MIIQSTNQKVASSGLRRAFSLLEMLVVVAIIVALAGMVSYYVLQQQKGAKKDEARIKIKNLEQKIGIYESKYDFPPENLMILTQNDGQGGPYAEEKDLYDPWNQPFQYDPTASDFQGVNKPLIATTAPDGEYISNYPQQ